MNSLDIDDLKKDEIFSKINKNILVENKVNEIEKLFKQISNTKDEIIEKNKKDEEHTEELFNDKLVIKKKKEIITKEIKIPKHKRYKDEDIMSSSWKNHNKHVFILSNAGRPIFSRYGREDNLATMMALLMAVTSFVEDDNDEINSILAGDYKIIFKVEGPLILVCVTRNNEPVSEISKMLKFLYLQLLFILTKSVISILKKNAKYDLRQLLGGTDIVLHNLISSASNTLDYCLESHLTLRMSNIQRNTINNILVKYKFENLGFLLLISNDDLIQISSDKNLSSLHINDFILLNNFKKSCDNFPGSQIWTPVCLPQLSSEGYLYSYIYFFSENLSLIMITLDKELFFKCQKIRELLEADLKKIKFFRKLKKREILNEFEDFEELRHFVFKDIQLQQYIKSKFNKPYNFKKEKKRLIESYKTVKDKLTSSNSNHKVYYLETSKEIIIGWNNLNFELYATFNLYTKKENILKICEKIRIWVKRERENLFIINKPTF